MLEPGVLLALRISPPRLVGLRVEISLRRKPETGDVGIDEEGESKEILPHLRESNLIARPDAEAAFVRERGRVWCVCV